MAATPKLLLRPIMNLNTKPFSTTARTLTQQPNPSYPPFSLKAISANPRVRVALGAGLALMALAEGYMWIKFWPRISGKGKKEAGASEAE